jgi:hypothetical protein
MIYPEGKRQHIGDLLWQAEAAYRCVEFALA